LNWHVEVDEFQDETPFGTKTFRNIIATYDISKPQRMVLSAHYDSKNMTSGKKEFVAATDSAIPCAILLDMAKQLTSSKIQSDNQSVPKTTSPKTQSNKNYLGW
jgi:glutaminyl-peptide cyclotransferase